MPKQIIIAEKHHISGVFAEDKIQELVVATGHQQVGDIYLGTVENVISGIDAAFVNIGDEKNGFIHVTDLGPLRLRKTSAAITKLLSPKQPVLVQVMKEPTSNKGPRLTGNISLPGRYLVLMPYGKGVSLSRRIKNENERNRLRALAILLKPSGMGLLVRTEAEGKAEENIMEDLEYLVKQWDKIQQEANSTKPPALLNRDDDFIQRVLRDMYSDDVNRIVVDSESAVKRVKQQLMNWSAGSYPEGVVIDYNPQYGSVLDYFRVNAAIKEALKPRVDLPSGGYLIIEPTEALTVIDVNSGSFTESATSRETVLWTNYEAAIEIARQLRLRNIGGVIVVDFIDMDSRRDKAKVLEHFNEALRADKAHPQIAQLSELGLVELTRKRQGKNIYELFTRPCPHCDSLGYLAHLPGHQQNEAISSSYISPVIVNKGLEKPTLLAEKSAFLDNYPDYLETADLVDYSDGNIRRRRRGELSVKEDSISVSNQAPEIEKKQARKERSYLSRTSRRDEIPLEKVVVEMTEAEQDIYALMGVSPLIHLEREFKDPKSILVLVKSADNSQNGDTSIDMVDVDSQAEENLNLDTDHDESDLDEVSSDYLATDSDFDLEENDNSTEEFAQLEEQTETITDKVISEALESDRPIVRTRRRRSSVAQA
jgi:ribonuclease E